VPVSGRARTIAVRPRTISCRTGWQLRTRAPRGMPWARPAGR